MKARYNYRIYPKFHQIEPLAKAFGCARVVWNDALWLYQKASIEGLPIPKDVDKQVITQAKKTEERAWLSEVSNIVLQQSFRDLQVAWNNYFSSLKGKRKGKPVGRPKFKKKQSRQTIRFRKGGFSVHSQSVKLAKIGHIKMVVSRPLPSAPSSVTIIKDCAGRYFASFVVEVPQKILAATNCSCGIDLGLTHFCILSSGEKIENPRLHKKMLKRIKKANRRLAKAKRDSLRREQRKKKLAKLHAQVKDQRTDFLHKLTTRLVSENQTLAVEDLNVSGLIRNRKLSRAISDAGWAKFKSMLAAKCAQYGRELTIVDRWFASSQICSECGKSGGKKAVRPRVADRRKGGKGTSRASVVHRGVTTDKQKSPLPARTKIELDVREWECLFCNTIHDRDINAAINLNIWAGGQSDHDKNGRGASVSQAKLAVCCEASTTYEQLSLF